MMLNQMSDYSHIDNFGHVPNELKELPQWVVVNKEKKPLDPSTHNYLKWKESAAWLKYEDAVTAMFQPAVAGAAFVFSTSDPYVGIDLDSPDKLHAEALRKGFGEDVATRVRNASREMCSYIVQQFAGAYMETSQSGNGVHIIVRGRLPEGAKKVTRGKLHCGVEVYAAEQYIWMTGRQIQRSAKPYALDGFQEVLDALVYRLWELFGKNGEFDEESLEPTTDGGRSLDLTDEQVIERLLKRSRDMLAIYNGGFGFNSTDWSECTKIMIGEIDKLTGDAGQVHRIVFNSPRLLSAGQSKTGEDRYARTERRFNPLLADCRGNNRSVLARTQANIDVGKQMAASLDAAFKREREQALTEQAARLDEMSTRLSPSPLEVDEYDSTPNFVIGFPPGNTGVLAQAMLKMMTYPNQSIGIAWALTAVAALAQRTYHINGLGLNLFVMALAETGSGKEALVSAATSFITQLRDSKDGEVGQAVHQGELAALMAIFGPASFASEPATYKHMSKNPKQWQVCNEASFLFEDMSRGDATHAVGRKKALLDIRYKSNKNGMIFGHVHSNAENNSGVAYMPSLTIIAEGQPERFYSAIDESAAEDGLLNRFMCFDCTRKHRGRRNRYQADRLDSEVVKLFLPLARRCYDGFVEVTDNKGGVSLQPDPLTVPELVEVKLSAEAEKMSWMYEDRVVDRLSRERSRIEYNLLNRSLAQILSVAALLAVADNAMDPVVQVWHFNWASDLVWRERKYLLNKYEQGEVGKGDVQRMAKVVERLHTFRASKSNRLSTAMKKFGVVPISWIQDAVKTASCFKPDSAGRGFVRMVQETVDALVYRGILEPVAKGDLKYINMNLKGACYIIVGNLDGSVEEEGKGAETP